LSENVKVFQRKGDCEGNLPQTGTRVLFQIWIGYISLTTS